MPYAIALIVAFVFAGFPGLIVGGAALWVSRRYSARVVAIGAAATLGLASLASALVGVGASPTMSYATTRGVSANLARSAAVLLMVAIVLFATSERAPFSAIVQATRSNRALRIPKELLAAAAVAAFGLVVHLAADAPALDGTSRVMADSLRAGRTLHAPGIALHPPLAAITAVLSPVSAQTDAALVASLVCGLLVLALRRPFGLRIGVEVAVLVGIGLVAAGDLGVGLALLGPVVAFGMVDRLEPRRLEVGRVVLAGLCVGLGTLAHPYALIALPFIAVWSGRQCSTRRAATRALLVIAGALVTIAPWSIYARHRGAQLLPGLGSVGAMGFALATIAAVALAGLRFRLEPGDLDAFFERNRGGLGSLRLVRPGPGASTVDAPLDARRHVVLGSVWMLASVAVGAIGGTAFWLLAAHRYTATAVGIGAALSSSLAFVNYATGMGLVVAVPRFAGRRDPSSDVLFSWGLLYTAVTGFVGGIAFLVLFHTGSSRALSEWSWVAGGLAFALIAVGTGLYVIADARLIVARRWDVVLLRVVLINVIRLPLLLTPLSGNALWVFLLSCAPLAIAGFVGVAWLPGRITGPYRLFPRPPVWNAALRFTHVNYAAMLAYQGPSMVIPVVVLVAVPAHVNASFYVAFGIVSVMFLVPSTITQVLLSEGSLDVTSVRTQTRTALGICVGLMLMALLAAIVGAPFIATVYGQSYREAGDILPWLVAAGIPWSVTCVTLTLARLRNDTLATLTIPTVLAVATIVPAMIVVHSHGVDGVTWAWLFGNVIAAIAGVVLLRLRAGRSPNENLGAVPVDERLS